MGGGELGSLCLVLAVVGLQVAAPVVLFVWARRVAAQRRTLFWRVLVWVPLGALGLSVIGCALSGLSIASVFGDMDAADPSQKALILEEGISATMNWSALFGVLTAVLHLATAAALFVGARKPGKSEAG